MGFCYLLWTKRQYLPFSPKPTPKSLEIFDSIPVSSSSPNPAARSPVECELKRTRVKVHLLNRSLAFFKTTWSAIVGLVSPPATSEIAYSPLPTTGDSNMFPRPPSMDADAVSLHSVYYNNANAPPRIRQHPITKKPSTRQRSRDVERGSPAIGRPNSDKSQAQWSWLPPQETAASPLLDSTVQVTEAEASNGKPSRPPMPADRRKLSDSESEVMDTLTDLGPVTSATSARGPATPRDTIPDPFSAMRKRSASSEGDRFYRENGLIPRDSRNGTPYR